MNRFKDQVIVVTGGGRGIGFAVAKQIVSEGGKVAIWSVSTAQDAAKELGGDTLGINVDVTSEEGIAAATQATIDKFGKVDVLITSAGTAGPYAPVQNYSLKQWKDLLDVHLDGTFLACRAVLKGMIEQDYGRIVTIASSAGKSGVANVACYSTAKAGIIAFTKSLGLELAKTNVRANVIAPGLIKTEIMDNLSPEQLKGALSTVPQGRIGTVEECAAMITFMASPACSFNSGAVFDLSGGGATY